MENLLIVSIGVTLYNGYRGLNIACGCFSLAAGESSDITVNTVRNLALLAAGLWVLVFTGRGRWQPAG